MEVLIELCMQTLLSQNQSGYHVRTESSKMGRQKHPHTHQVVLSAQEVSPLSLMKASQPLSRLPGVAVSLP